MSEDWWIGKVFGEKEGRLYMSGDFNDGKYSYGLSKISLARQCVCDRKWCSCTGADHVEHFGCDTWAANVEQFEHIEGATTTTAVFQKILSSMSLITAKS